jgi:electron transfer flavoprotein beta subunit
LKKIVVLVKQVPDTANISGDSMKEDGTVNRARLPAIFNPEDLNALEMALEIKDKLNSKVIAITMGPPSAVTILKQSLYMGADEVILISDRKFAGADTLATSYVLSEAIKKIGDVDLVLAGRQAIDGDTAQVGPQVAEKIEFNQITYVTKLKEIQKDFLVVERDGEVQTEVIKAKCPVLLTVMGEANEPRFPNCINILKNFKADTKADGDLKIPMQTMDELKLDESRCGLHGSPTKVFKIKSIKLAGGNLEHYEATNAGIEALINDIKKDYIEVN